MPHRHRRVSGSCRGKVIAHNRAPGRLGRSQRWSWCRQVMGLQRPLPTGEERDRLPGSATSVRCPWSLVSWDGLGQHRASPQTLASRLRQSAASLSTVARQCLGPARRRPSRASGFRWTLEVHPQFSETPFRLALQWGRGGETWRSTPSLGCCCLPTAPRGNKKTKQTTSSFATCFLSKPLCVLCRDLQQSGINQNVLIFTFAKECCGWKGGTRSQQAESHES